MPKNPIEKLEELIPKLVDETRQLREDNQRLEKEIKTFRTDLERAQKNGANLQSKIERLGKLETVQKRLEKDQTKIRSTVKNLLAGIEKISIPGKPLQGSELTRDQCHPQEGHASSKRGYPLSESPAQK